MTRIEQYKTHLAEGEKSFLGEYLPSIEQFLEELDAKDALIGNHSEVRVERIMKFIYSSNAPLTLKNNLFKIFNSDKNRPEENIKKLQDLGFKTDNIAEQFGSIMCHGYQVVVERLKLYFVSIIDFTILGLNNADEHSFGPILGVLQGKFSNNKFVNFLNTKIRNPVTHYTYYFDKGELFLCDGYFDESPKKMTLADFMIETKNWNILSDAFFLLFLDKYRAEGPLTLDNQIFPAFDFR